MQRQLFLPLWSLRTFSGAANPFAINPAHKNPLFWLQLLAANPSRNGRRTQRYTPTRNIAAECGVMSDVPGSRNIWRLGDACCKFKRCPQIPSQAPSWAEPAEIVGTVAVVRRRGDHLLATGLVLAGWPLPHHTTSPHTCSLVIALLSPLKQSKLHLNNS